MDTDCGPLWPGGASGSLAYLLPYARPLALGDDALKAIARELVETVQRNVTIAWVVKESVRAKLRIMVKRLLRKYGYLPDRQEQAVKMVLEQVEVLSKDWAT